MCIELVIIWFSSYMELIGLIYVLSLTATLVSSNRAKGWWLAVKRSFTLASCLIRFGMFKTMKRTRPRINAKKLGAWEETFHISSKRMSADQWEVRFFGANVRWHVVKLNFSIFFIKISRAAMPTLTSTAFSSRLNNVHYVSCRQKLSLEAQADRLWLSIDRCLQSHLIAAGRRVPTDTVAFSSQTAWISRTA